MKAIAINGSPRKNWNTHILLQKALDGAASNGAETELVNLYDLSYQGCISCLECKRRGGKSVGKCAVNDDLKPVLERIAACDALILGSPIYLAEVTGMMRAFLERLLFQYISYDKDRQPQFDQRIQTAFLYTMNAPEAALGQIGYTDKFKYYEMLLELVFGPARTLVSTETCQVKDYEQYHMTLFDADQRKKRRQEVFPMDCQSAYELGASMVI